MIASIIFCWIVSGVIAAYIGHTLLDESRFNTTLLETVICAIFGGVAFAVVILTLISRHVKIKNIANYPIFRKKS